MIPNRATLEALEELRARAETARAKHLAACETLQTAKKAERIAEDESGEAARVLQRALDEAYSVGQ